MVVTVVVVFFNLTLEKSKLRAGYRQQEMVTTASPWVQVVVRTPYWININLKRSNVFSGEGEEVSIV